MNTVILLMREAWVEAHAGMRRGIPLQVLLGLASYLLMALTSVDYVHQMGASDIIRNAPGPIFLMSCGCMFFLFFAWAWVFSQPALRDRKVQLEEVVLTLPVSLPTLLWGRFIGAALVGGALASLMIVGFVASPVLGWLGWGPTVSICVTAWSALGFAWVAFLLPVSAGIGALYYLLALRSGSLAAPFGLAAVLMLLWVFTVVVFKGREINQLLAVSLDPFLLTFTQVQMDTMTPVQKSHSLLALTSGFWFSRGLWCVLPLLILAVVLARTSRQGLMGLRSCGFSVGPLMQLAADNQLHGPLIACRWSQVLWREAHWQVCQVFDRKIWWVSLGLSMLMGMLSGAVHVVWHIRGPMMQRADLTLPLLSSASFLVTAFIITTLGGLVCRRDNVEGLSAMLQVTAAPVWLRWLGRVLCMLMATLLLALVPGAASLLLISCTTSPGTLALGFALIYQGVVFAPSLLVLALLTVLAHALIRHGGLAHAISMLLMFFLVLSHELDQISCLLYQMAFPFHAALSRLAGWGTW